MEKQSEFRLRGPDIGAEREVGAFMRTITELFGPEQARLAADDWINERESMDALLGVNERDWASAIVAAPAQLVRRLNADLDRPMSSVASTDTKVSRYLRPIVSARLVWLNHK